jgi:putative component of toxin-antitoxin plasmid stabilization module
MLGRVQFRTLLQMFEEFESRLRNLSMQFEKCNVSPAKEIAGVAMATREEEYEAGYRLYVVQHGGVCTTLSTGFSISMALNANA